MLVLVHMAHLSTSCKGLKLTSSFVFFFLNHTPLYLLSFSLPDCLRDPISAHVGYPPEKTLRKLGQSNGKSLLAERLHWVFGDLSASRSLCQGGFSNTKAHTSVSKNGYPEVGLQKARSKVRIFMDFPRTIDFDGVGVYSHFDRWCCLLVRLQSL